MEGVRRGYKTVERVYEKEGVKDNCQLIITPKGHWWNVDVMWKKIREEMEKLGWDL